MSPIAISVLESSPMSILGWIALLVIGYPIWKGIYNLTFHPLRNYPGPLLAAATPFAHFAWIYRGVIHTKILSLHDQYGDVVRIAPNTLVYRSPQAWKDICGHRKAGMPSFEKDREFYPIGPSGPSLIASTEADHSRMRRLLAHAFSEKAMREQEPLLQSYIDLLIRRLHENATTTTAVDMTKWFNYTTFDIIGDLSFGEPFDCLETSSYHPWVLFVFRSFKGAALMRPFLSLLPPRALKLFVPSNLRKMRENNFYLSRQKVLRRLSLQTTRPDFLTYVLRYNDERGMTQGEIEANAALLITAGSETTATLLAGCTFFMLRDAEVRRRLVTEIRTTFEKQDDITFLSVAGLPYLNAVLEESLRMYPPIPGILPRRVPDGGAVIDGQFVPGGTAVSMGYLSAFRAKSNFADANSFLPERWLDRENPRFAADKREVMQPFSYGPRNCLGKNLAYAEMRLIVAKLWWYFDLAPVEDISGWMEQQSFVAWLKKPLNVKLTPVRR